MAVTERHGGKTTFHAGWVDEDGRVLCYLCTGSCCSSVKEMDFDSQNKLREKIIKALNDSGIKFLEP